MESGRIRGSRQQTSPGSDIPAQGRIHYKNTGETKLEPRPRSSSSSPSSSSPVPRRARLRFRARERASVCIGAKAKEGHVERLYNTLPIYRQQLKVPQSPRAFRLGVITPAESPARHSADSSRLCRAPPHPPPHPIHQVNMRQPSVVQLDVAMPFVTAM